MGGRKLVLHHRTPVPARIERVENQTTPKPLNPFGIVPVFHTAGDHQLAAGADQGLEYQARREFFRTLAVWGVWFFMLRDLWVHLKPETLGLERRPWPQ